MKFHLKVSQSHYKTLDLSMQFDELQPEITEFATNCSRDQLIIAQLIRNDKAFRKEIEDNKARETLEQPNFLCHLLSQSLRKAKSGNRLYRYDRYMKEVGLYLFILAGPLAYETLQKNLPLPSIATVKRLLGAENKMREGELQVDAIKKQIDKLGLPPFIWAAEDDTRMQTRLRYNIEDDTIVGLELPLDNNGVPIASFFKFTSISAVRAYIKKYRKTSYAKLVTCKSLSPGSKTFVVVVYGTTGTDQSAGVMKRWSYIHKAFRDVGLTVMGKKFFFQTKCLKSKVKYICRILK